MSNASVIAAAVEVLITAGFEPDGHTPVELVRIATVDNPVYGGIGGKNATFGGRARFKKGDRRVTVGARTTCFFRYVPATGDEPKTRVGLELRPQFVRKDGMKPDDFRNVQTRGLDRLAEVAREEAPEAAS